MTLEIIDANGRVEFVTQERVEAIRSDGYFRVIHLDANIALELSKIGAGKTSPAAKAATGLLQFAVSSECAIDHDLAVAELAAGAARSAGDHGRAASLLRDITAGIHMAEGHLGLRSGVVSIGHLGKKETDSYRRIHLSSYTHLLRIEQIAKQRSGKAPALRNLTEYLEWANDELKMVSAHCFQVALDVFGGEQRTVRLLSVDSMALQENRAWNAAWDLVHAFAMHYETTRPIGRKTKRVLLATRDKALSYVARRCLVAAFVKSGPMGDFTIAGYKLDQPFLVDRKREVEELVRAAFESQRRRIDRGETCTPREMSQIRDKLEVEMGIRALSNRGDG